MYATSPGFTGLPGDILSRPSCVAPHRREDFTPFVLAVTTLRLYNRMFKELLQTGWETREIERDTRRTGSHGGRARATREAKRKREEASVARDVMSIRYVIHESIIIRVPYSASQQSVD